MPFILRADSICALLVRKAIGLRSLPVKAVGRTERARVLVALLDFCLRPITALPVDFTEDMIHRGTRIRHVILGGEFLAVCARTLIGSRRFSASPNVRVGSRGLR